MIPAALIFLLAGLGLAWIAIADRNIAAGLFGAVALLLAVDFGWMAWVMRRERRVRAKAKEQLCRE